jgi:hypothetical protein
VLPMLPMITDHACIYGSSRLLRPREADNKVGQIDEDKFGGLPDHYIWLTIKPIQACFLYESSSVLMVVFVTEVIRYAQFNYHQRESRII